MLKKTAIALMLFFIMISCSSAQTLSFPSDEPVISINFPRSWSVEIDQDEEAGVIALSRDEEIEIDFWMINRRAMRRNSDLAIEKAMNQVEKIINDFVRNYEVTQEGEGEINDIDYFFLEGKGVYKESRERIKVNIALLTPDREHLFVLLYWGTNEAESIHKRELDKIFESIQKVGYRARRR